jgi:hypothetical protein
VPVMSVQGSQPGGEGFGVSQGFQSAMEANLALAEVALQSADKLTAKNFRSNGDGKKERSESAMEPNESDRATIRRAGKDYDKIAVEAPNCLVR